MQVTAIIQFLIAHSAHIAELSTLSIAFHADVRLRTNRQSNILRSLARARALMGSCSPEPTKVAHRRMRMTVVVSNYEGIL